LQGNVPQNEKIEARQETDKFRMINVLERDYFRLAHKAYGDGIVRRPDLILWPETCFPDNWIMPAPELVRTAETEGTFQLVELSQRRFWRTLEDRLPPVPMLLGLNRLELLSEEDYRKYNSALLIGPGVEELASYDKMHLVPFGEYVPLGEWLPWLQAFTPYRHAYSCTPGDRFTRFELNANGRTYRFGVLICYEDSDPDLARQYHPFSGRGPGVDFLVNISNDGWFDGTEEHEQHLAICRFRAIEARRSVVRAVNMGISAVIDGDGRIKALPASTWADSKKMAGVVRAEVPIDTRSSVYAAAGDWLPGFCWLMLIVAHFVARRHRVTRSHVHHRTSAP
jgi:apolipoprotein N-acyltransferase